MPLHSSKTIVEQTLAACRGGFIAVLVFSVVINVLVLALPIYSLQVFERVLSSRSLETLIALTVLIVALLALQAALDHVRSAIMRRIAFRVETTLTVPALQVTLAEAARGNRLAASGISDLREVRIALSHPGLTALFDAPCAPFFLLVIFIIHPALGWFVVLSITLLMALAVANAVASRRPQDEERRAACAASEHVNDYVRQAEAIHSMGMGANLLRRWADLNCRIVELNARILDRIGFLLAITKFTRIVVQIGVTGLGAWLVLQNAISPGAMIASSILMARALGPVEHAVGGWKSWLQGWEAWTRLVQMLHAPVLPRSDLQLPAPKGILEVSDLTFRPSPRSEPIIQGVSFSLQPGNSLAVVGQSGAGKSTLARLIAGAWNPTRGEVRLDGADLATWNRDDLGRHIGYLPQDVQLLCGTVLENISRFDPQVNSEAVIAAAKAAGVHDLILRLPDGYDAALGKGGVQLSGGQQQRIGLARALYGDPRLIVLDEPNSHLDPFGEASLVETIQACRRAGRTVVFVSHRAPLLRTADWIIVMHDGRIERAGAREALMQTLGQQQPSAERSRMQAAPRSPGRVPARVS